MPHFMIVLIPYINLLNLSWIMKCLFLRNMEPLSFVNTLKRETGVRHKSGFEANSEVKDQLSLIRDISDRT